MRQLVRTGQPPRLGGKIRLIGGRAFAGFPVTTQHPGWARSGSTITWDVNNWNTQVNPRIAFGGLEAGVAYEISGNVTAFTAAGGTCSGRVGLNTNVEEILINGTGEFSETRTCGADHNELRFIILNQTNVSLVEIQNLHIRRIG